MFSRYEYVKGFIPIIDSENTFFINVEGQITDKNNLQLSFKTDEEGYKTIECKSWDGYRCYRVVDLLVIHFKYINLPKENFNDIIGFHINDDKNDLHCKNIGYRFKGGKIELKGFPGFYYVPGFTRIAIKENGLVLDVKTHKFKSFFLINPTRDFRGVYFTVGGISFNFKTVNTGRHRLLCLTFKPFPNNVDDLHVNHIDGIPGNDDLNNLEWVTASENTIHGHVYGFNKNHKEVLARNVLTGEVTEFYSVNKLTEFLKFARETVLQRLDEKNFGRVFPEGYQYKFKEDHRNWINVSNPKQEIINAQWRLPVLVRNCLTLEITTYETLSHASRGTDVHLSAIRYRLRTDNRKPLYGLQFKLESDNREWESFTKEEYLMSLSKEKTRVNARNLLTKEEMIFSSPGSAKAYFNISSIEPILKKGRQPFYKSGWQFKYEHSTWEEIVDIEEAIYCLNRTIVAREESSGKILISDNATHLSKILGFRNDVIRSAALTKGHQLYRGYRFRLGFSDKPWPNA